MKRCMNNYAHVHPCHLHQPPPPAPFLRNPRFSGSNLSAVHVQLGCRAILDQSSYWFWTWEEFWEVSFREFPHTLSAMDDQLPEHRTRRASVHSANSSEARLKWPGMAQEWPNGLVEIHKMVKKLKMIQNWYFALYCVRCVTIHLWGWVWATVKSD